MTTGILFALLAMLFFGFGDFLIQRSTRKVGDWETLFLITFFGNLILLPFIWSDVGYVFSGKAEGLPIVLGAGIVILCAALLEFESLRKGKLSVVESAFSFEIPTTVLCAYIFLGEKLALIQIVILFVLIIGLFLVSYRGTLTKRVLFEKGAVLSIIAASIMGIANFFVGWGARETTPLLVNFFINLVSLVGSGIFLLWKGRFLNIFRDLARHPRTLVPMVILDNAAWVAFAFSLALAPIGIATALSESYIIVTVLLGLFVNKEKLQRHQKMGLLLAVTCAILLAFFLS
jgi:drug/metabolite transporter (DMT)-like permease